MSLAAVAASLALAAVPDRVSVIVPESRADLLEGGASAGRVLLFLKSPAARVRSEIPADGPFPDDPQPMYSRAAPRVEAGVEIEFGDDAEAFPVPISQLRGRFQVQAVLDRDRTERRHLAPGNLVSEVVEVDFDPDSEQVVRIPFSRRLPPAEAPPEIDGVAWEEMPSRMLSDFAKKPASIRAGVVLPRRYHELSAPRRQWPVVYVIPGFGGRHTMAAQYARMVAMAPAQLVAPQVAWVVLDPETPLGHHGFADGDRHGPVARALVEEFIPWLEEKYRFVPAPEARIVTGHSSGGWSALWLQLAHPATFGACFASAPDPVDFSAFQRSDLYRDESLFKDAEGAIQPSLRAPLGAEYDRILLTVADEVAMERVLDPDGDSGEQWDAWNAVFSRVDATSGRSRPMFDRRSGSIDRAVVEQDWSRYDIAKLLERNWSSLGPIMVSRVRLLCGDRDGFYLDRAVSKLRELVQRKRAESAAAGTPLEGPGYVELVPGATHGTLPSMAKLRWHGEMREHLRRHGLADD
ncbi:MAG: hypothetical protein FJ253_07645 [Phycisphaerae bacterium]|nr:hypothetical protein [Phycisphaerae bacterium]